MNYRVIITEVCLTMIEKIVDKKIRGKIVDRIEGLSTDPGNQGKSLAHSLSEFRSIRVAARYRIVFKIDNGAVVVYAVAAGIRKQADKKDVYAIAKKLLKAGLLNPDSRM